MQGIRITILWSSSQGSVCMMRKHKFCICHVRDFYSSSCSVENCINIFRTNCYSARHQRCLWCSFWTWAIDERWYGETPPPTNHKVGKGISHQLCSCAAILFTMGWYWVFMCFLACSEPGWPSHSSYRFFTRGFSKGSDTKTYET